MTIAREYERGSMEQLFATPTGRLEVILGKLTPYFFIGLVQVLLVLTLGVTLFDVPVRGSVALLFGVSAVFLLAMHSVIHTGGPIPSILIGVPGSGPDAATVIDGFPMAQKGEARRALDMALYSSCFADFVSNLSLIIFTGFLASFALRFGPPEFFTLIFFSLSIIAGVSGDKLSKGIISACFGLILATIGPAINSGSPKINLSVP